MKISTKGRYALRMMLDLAQYQGEGYVSLNEIAERQHISKKYLEQIVPLLNKASVLKTVRGYQGGYRLAKPTREITLGDVLRATEGSLSPVACLEYDDNDCPYNQTCMTLPVWQGLKDAISNYVDNITLQDIIDNYSASAVDQYII